MVSSPHRATLFNGGCMKLLVCGGRDFNDPAAVERVLTLIHEKHGIDTLIHGAATGADNLASEWATRNNIYQDAFRANWGAHGKAAGPIRNKDMLNHGKPDAVVAFPGGRGTSDMVRRAKKAGVKVWEPYLT